MAHLMASSARAWIHDDAPALHEDEIPRGDLLDDAIESINAHIHHAVKARGRFPDGHAALT
jgi:hypothetical protein